jgi:hypothetical protein
VDDVTTAIRRQVAAAVLIAAAFLLAACGSGPSQVNSALIVGSTSVTVDQVQNELNDVLATQTTSQQAQLQSKLDQASRALVRGHVLHVLLQKATTQYGLAVTDQQVDQVISQAGGTSKAAAALFIDPANIRDGVRDLLLEVALARKYADTLNVTFGYVVAKDRATAVQDAQQLAADPNKLTGLVNAANAAAKAAGGTSGGATTTQFSISSYLQGIAQAQQQAQQQGQTAPTEDLSPVFGAPANSVVAFQPAAAADPSWIVAIIKTHAAGAGTAPGSPSSADSSDLGTLESVGINLLQPQASALGVRISPRYGNWNQAGMTVTAGNDQTADVELPVKKS